MGRKKEFVASKSFTLGLQELLYMEKVCNEKKWPRRPHKDPKQPRSRAKTAPEQV